MTQIPIIQPRTCGECTLCCTLMGVPELNKAAVRKCMYQNTEGCTVYEQRPYVCKSFACLWLLSRELMPDDNMRPDRQHVLMFVPDTDKHLSIHVNSDYDRRHLSIHVDPAHEQEGLANLHQGPLNKVLNTFLQSGMHAIVSCGDKRKLLGSEEVLRRKFPQLWATPKSQNVPKQGRNELCACQSGRKHKHCCGR